MASLWCLYLALSIWGEKSTLSRFGEFMCEHIEYIRTLYISLQTTLFSLIQAAHDIEVALQTLKNKG